MFELPDTHEEAEYAWNINESIIPHLRCPGPPEYNRCDIHEKNLGKLGLCPNNLNQSKDFLVIFETVIASRLIQT